jgi:hypothetical protein
MGAQIHLLLPTQTQEYAHPGRGKIVLVHTAAVYFWCLHSPPSKSYWVYRIYR